MKMAEKDIDFRLISEDIIINESFNKLKKMTHHGLNRYDHSMKVAYLSYKVAKFLKLDYIKVARAGLLHDFFETSNKPGLKNRVKSILVHPNISVENSKKLFGLSELEEEIIKTHMFPIGKHIPKHKESWVVNVVDKGVSLYEASVVSVDKLNYASVLLSLFFINLLK